MYIPESQSAISADSKRSPQRALRIFGAEREYFDSTDGVINAVWIERAARVRTTTKVRATTRVAPTMQRLFEAYSGLDSASVSRVEHLNEALIINLSRDWINVHRGAIGRLFDTDTNIQGVTLNKIQC